MPKTYHEDRLRRLQERLVGDGLGGMLVAQADSIYYLTGFFHYPSERPILAWVPAQGELTLVVPLLEADHAAGTAGDLIVYDEFPGRPGAWDIALERLRDRGLGEGRVGYEGSLPVVAFERLRRAARGGVAEAGGHVTALRAAKGPEEIALLRKAGLYSDLMVAEGMRFVAERGPDVREVEVVEQVTRFVLESIAAEGDELVFVQSVGGGLVCFGDHSALPHALPTLRRLGDDHVVLLSLGCMVGGYAAESERTFYLQAPSDEERRVHEAVEEAQEAGFAALRAGTPCEEADQAARRVLEASGLGAHIRHRLGHGMGLRFHEPPWVAPGDPTPLPVGAVVSCEPGLYLPGRFGVRIADTVLVGAHGPERLTQHPRGWQAG
jgi:Xaa-Pro dipeptidase